MKACFFCEGIIFYKYKAGGITDNSLMVCSTCGTINTTSRIESDSGHLNDFRNYNDNIVKSKAVLYMEF